VLCQLHQNWRLTWRRGWWKQQKQYYCICYGLIVHARHGLIRTSTGFYEYPCLSQPKILSKCTMYVLRLVCMHGIHAGLYVFLCFSRGEIAYK
jgi:hypothetical protein